LKPVSVAGVVFGAGPGVPPAGVVPPGGVPPAPPAPQGEVTLIDAFMPPIRDQANRGTCVAFASVACLEYYRARFCGQPGLDLSEQYQFWDMVTATGQRNLVSGFPLLRDRGVCREQTWPYYGNVIPPADDQGPAPAAAGAEAPAYTCRTVRQLPDPRSVPDIQQELSAGRVVGIGIPVYNSWYQSGIVRQYGNINVPLPGEVPMPVGHAIALVGYADDPDFAGGGYFIVRNSWDSYWATLGVFGPGYGTIPYRYITGFNWDAWCIIA
jgi:C1A family cysteine protease